MGDRNTCMGDQGAHKAGIQAEQPQVVEEPNEVKIPIASYQVPPPEKFNFKPEEWFRWIKCFKRFQKGTGLDQKDGESQVSTLIYSMGKEADDIVMSFGLTTEEAKQYNVVKGKFEAHFVVKRNIIFE